MMLRARPLRTSEPVQSILAYQEVSQISCLVEERLGEPEARMLRDAADARIFGDTDADLRCVRVTRWFEAAVEPGDEELADASAELGGLLAAIAPVARPAGHG